MNRREMLVKTAGSMTTLVAGLSTAAAADNKASTGTGKYDQLAETSRQCITTALVCTKHCQTELAQGNKSMAECLQSVLELTAVCEALEKLALYNSNYTKDFARNSAKICADCAKICEKHAHHMEACKKCMEACKACEKACLAVA